MRHADLRDELRRRWFGSTLIVVVFFGYTVGKDRALRDNLMDARIAAENAPAGKDSARKSEECTDER